jgi:membrane fusion protein, multidrug efflux system
MNAIKGRIQKGRSVAAVAVLLLGVAACGGGEENGAEAAEAPAAAPEVVLGADDVARAELSRLASAVSLTGSLDPYQVVEVRAQVPGQVSNLRVDRGQAVSRGQVMAVIEAEGIRSQAAGARAGVAAAEAQLALARRQLESARTLYEAGAMSEIDFRGAQTQYEAAQAQLAAARAQAAGAGEQARRATVTAPISGEVSSRQVSEGEAVNPGQALFTVVNTEFLELAGQVPVNQAAQVRAGQPVEFSLAAYPGRTFRGEVARVEPTADPATRQLGVYVRLPNRDRALVGGQFATGRILSGGETEAVVIPSAALRQQGEQTFVWAIEDGVVARRPVTLGSRDEARGVVAITGGLEAGQQVVVAPGAIQEGTRVRVGVQAAPAPTGEEG